MTAPDPRGQKILQALARRDNAALLALMDDDGVDGSWADARGQTILHFAALRGDSDLCDALIVQKKADVLAMTDKGDRPSRMAAIYGHADLARHLAAIEENALVAKGLPVIESLASLREKGDAARALYDLACAGQFAAAVDAARRNGECFTREELLYEGQAGESTLLRLCQTGQISPVQGPAFFTPDVWRDFEDLYFSLRDSLPQVYHGRFNSAHARWPKPAAAQPADGQGVPRGRPFRLPPPKP